MTGRKDWVEEKWGSLNKAQHARDIILGIENQKYLGGIARFISLTVEKLEELIKRNFLNLDDKQNEAPTIQEFYELMKKYPCVKAHGYAVDKERSDYRISIEGLHHVGNDISKELQLDFMKLCRKADDLTCTDKKLYSWWD
jgi:hypothetical protein